MSASDSGRASPRAGVTRLHPGYVDALLRASADKVAPTEAVRAVTQRSIDEFAAFFRARIRAAGNFKIMVQEVMILPPAIADRVREAYPEDEFPGYDVREHVIELVENTVARAPDAGGDTTAATAAEQDDDEARLVLNWKSITLKGRQPNVSKWPVDTAARMLAQLVLRPSNGYALPASAIIDRVSSAGLEVYLRRVKLNEADAARLLELYRAVADGDRNTMVQRIQLLNPFMRAIVAELDAWRHAHRSILHTIWNAEPDSELGREIDTLLTHAGGRTA